MVEVVLFQIYFVPLEVEHGNENTVYLRNRNCGKFCFRAIRQK
jgi:hypothetical protein